MNLDLEIDFSLVLSVMLIIFTCYMFGLFDPIIDFFSKPQQQQKPAAPQKEKTTKQEVVERLSGPDCQILFGTQTGTAEIFARKLHTEGRQYTFNTKLIDLESYRDELAEAEFVIFVTATYGEGEPTDNARDFWDWISEEEVDLSNLKYTIFGLGNTTYEHYNWMARSLDKRLTELGAQRVYEKGEGDDDSTLEDDFAKWKEGLWPSLVEHFNIDTDKLNIRDSTLDRKWVYRKLTESTERSKKHLAASNGLGQVDIKNPCAITVTDNHELHGKDSDRSCRHLDLDIGYNFTYEAGDHLGVYSENRPEIVEEAAKVLGVELAELFCLYERPEDFNPETQKPLGNRVLQAPTTVRQALTQFCELTAIPRKNVLKVFAAYAQDEKEKQKLTELSSTTPEPYNSFIKEDSRSVLEVLKHFASIKIPFDHFLETCPRLAPRYYSISSSPKEERGHVTITSVVVEFTSNTGRHHKGVCSNWFLEQDKGSQIFAFPRRSTFKLPKDPNTPIIMVGPGTGLAPFRGFLQERKHNLRTKQIKAETVLFFGCRTPTSDFLYQDELNDALEEGYLTKLVVAFSRQDPKNKVYVQHKMEEMGAEMWDLIENKKAYMYICGDGKNMEKSVNEALHRIVAQHGNKTPEQVQEYFAGSFKSRYMVDVW